MTVEQFYTRAVVDGRAVLSGSAAKPVAWIVRVPGTVRDAYCLCRQGSVEVAILDARLSLTEIHGHSSRRRYFVTAGRQHNSPREQLNGQRNN